MSLQEFVNEFVREADPTDFVVKDDLLSSYTQWRQDPSKPLMQIADLERASVVCSDIMPATRYNERMSVLDSSGQKGTVACSWKGLQLTWPGGNKTQPVPDDTPEAEPERECVQRLVHACFHFATSEYDPEQLERHVLNRVTRSSPDDIEHLHEKVRNTLKALGDKPRSGVSWRMDAVEHEGLVYNVFCKS